MKLLCTIASGDSINYDGITVPRMYSYARRHGADFYAVTGRTHGPVWDATNNCEGGPSTWKLPLLRWFTTQSHYRQLAYVDADTYIKCDAPSIFDAASGMPGFHACRDMNSDRELPLWTSWVQQRYGFPLSSDPLPFYANAGVWAVSQTAARAMNYASGDFPEVHTRWQEQDVMNLLAHHSSTLRELDPAFNVPYPYATQDPNAGHFLHACGINQGDKLEWFTKLESLGI